MTKSKLPDAQELRALIAEATDEDLSDGGRYFADSCSDLTQCRHQEIGEYQRCDDGRLIEWLWNHRAKIAEILETNSLDIDKLRQGLDLAANRLLACAVDAIASGNIRAQEFGDWSVEARRSLIEAGAQ